MKSQIVRPQKSNILQKTGWGVMLFLALLIFLLAGRYLTLNPQVYFSEQKAVYMAHTVMLIMHIVGAMLAVLLGPFQFLPKIRTGRFLNLHRWLGRAYLLSVLVGGLGGLYMARLAYGGLPARLGFTTLAVLWLFSAAMAYKHIRKKEIERHREWMTRNYALTFAGVTLRLWQMVFHGAGMDFLTGYMIVAWLSWIPNLMVAQWIISRRRRSQPRSTGFDRLSHPVSGHKTAQTDF
jgi:uncharacterized membrane protein